MHTCIGKSIHDKTGGHNRKTCWLKCQAIGVLLTHSFTLSPNDSLTHSLTHSLIHLLSLCLSHSHTLVRSRGQTYCLTNLQLVHTGVEGTLTLTSRSHTEWRVHSFSPPNLNAEWRAHLLQLSPSLSLKMEELFLSLSHSLSPMNTLTLLHT